MLSTSSDGRDWTMPIVIFPQWNDYRDPYHPIRSQLHQRMGFYVSPNGKLLVISHYGLWNNEQNDIFGGPGHVVREVHEDGTLGPIYFVRFGEKWDESNAPYPFYKASSDQAFVDACNNLLANKFVTDQWFELERGYPADAYIQIPGIQANSKEAMDRRKALSFFHRADGSVVGIWKKAWTSVSTDDGKSWSVPVQAPGIAHTFAKLWGQRTSDGRYALAYDPFDSKPGYRWPLTVTTSDDGVNFDHMLTVFGELPFRRYQGWAKNNGPQYMRGVQEGDPQPPDGAMWMVFSVNKEDIWVTRIPVPIRSEVSTPVKDDFDNMATGGIVTDWNIYSPRWAPVKVVDYPSTQNKSLQLTDGDPYDYARAVRVFPASGKGSVSFRLLANQSNGEMDVELNTPNGKRPIRLTFTDRGNLEIANAKQIIQAGNYPTGKWLAIAIEFDAARQKYSVRVDGKTVLKDGSFAEPAQTLQRLSFRTGPYRSAYIEQSNGLDDKGVFVGHIDPPTDHPLKEPAVFYVDDVTTN
jgi:hypothetical protein